MTRHRLGRFAISLLSCAAVLAAVADDNSAPAGWTLTPSDSGGPKRYVSGSGDDAVEFRLHAPRAGRGDALQRFRARLGTPPAGVDHLLFGEAGASANGFTAVGKGRAGARAVMVVAMACRTRADALVYGELVAPANKDSAKRAAADAATVLARACTAVRDDEGVAAAPATAPATARATAPATALATAPATTRAAAAAPTPPAPAPKPQPAPNAHAVAPGKGLRAGDIEGLLHTWKQTYRVTGLKIEDDDYLLLKDGTWRYGLPRTPLDEWNAAAARAEEKGKWGRWRKNGASYQLQRDSTNPNDKSDGWSSPSHQSLRQSTRPGERLNGIYVAASSARIGTTFAWRTDRVTLTSAGRFAQSYSGAVGGTVGAGSDQSVSARTVYDNKGSAGVVSGPNIGGGSSTTRPDDLADRSGRYEIGVWSIELRYDSGRIERLPFHASDDRNLIYFNGLQLLREKRK